MLAEKYKLGGVEREINTDTLDVQDAAVYEDELEQFNNGQFSSKYSTVSFARTDFSNTSDAFINSIFTTPTSITLDKLHIKDEAFAAILAAFDANKNLKQLNLKNLRISNDNCDTLAKLAQDRLGMMTLNFENLIVSQEKEAFLRMIATTTLQEVEKINSGPNELTFSVHIPQNVVQPENTPKTTEDLKSDARGKKDGWCIVS